LSFFPSPFPPAGIALEEIATVLPLSGVVAGSLSDRGGSRVGLRGADPLSAFVRDRIGTAGTGGDTVPTCVGLVPTAGGPVPPPDREAWSPIATNAAACYEKYA